MAHSIQEHKGHFLILHDTDTLVIGISIINIVEQTKSSPLIPMVNTWKKSFDLYCPGAIDLYLNEFLTTTEMYWALLKALDRIEKIAAAHPDFNIKSLGKIYYLPSPKTGIECGSVPSNILINAIQQLRGLIRNKRPAKGVNPEASQREASQRGQSEYC